MDARLSHRAIDGFADPPIHRSVRKKNPLLRSAVGDPPFDGVADPPIHRSVRKKNPLLRAAIGDPPFDGFADSAESVKDGAIDAELADSRIRRFGGVKKGRHACAVFESADPRIRRFTDSVRKKTLWVRLNRSLPIRGFADSAG